MTSAAAAASRNHDWEREFAPKVTRRRLLVGIVIYAAWLAFLAVLAGERWLGSLQ